MNRRVLFLVNHDIVVYNFRKELVEELLDEGYDVFISSPPGKKIDILIKKGCKFIETKINRHGINIKEDYKLIKFYNKIISEVKPIVVLTYTIKPNIYGGLAAKKHKIPYIANITGLGTAVEKKGLLQKISVFLYRLAFSKIHTVFFQNQENMDFFIKRKIAINRHVLLPGSGVNIDEFKYQPYPNDGVIHFAFISRIMKEKGIDLYLAMASDIKMRYPHTAFHVCGFCEDDYIDILSLKQDEGIINYHGMVDDIKEVLANMHCIVHPSYYPEGMSNVLLESSAIGRPIITTNRSGCKEIVDDEITGYLMNSISSTGLIECVEKFLKLSNQEKEKMGFNARLKMENSFDRRVVIKSYVDAIKALKHNSY